MVLLSNKLNCNHDKIRTIHLILTKDAMKDCRAGRFRRFGTYPGFEIEFNKFLNLTFTEGNIKCRTKLLKLSDNECKELKSYLKGTDRHDIWFIKTIWQAIILPESKKFIIACRDRKTNDGCQKMVTNKYSNRFFFANSYAELEALILNQSSH